MRRLSLCAVPVLAVVVAATVASCGGGGADVVVIGDSLVFQADRGDQVGDETQYLKEALEDGGYDAEVIGNIGLSLPIADQSVWPEVVAQPPDILVVALGTNDSHNGASPLSTSRSILSRWLSQVPEACVVLVEVSSTTDSWGLDVYAPPFNAMLHEVAADHPNAHVVEWAPDASRLEADGIHLSEEGREAYRQTIISGVEDCQI